MRFGVDWSDVRRREDASRKGKIWPGRKCQERTPKSTTADTPTASDIDNCTCTSLAHHRYDDLDIRLASSSETDIFNSETQQHRQDGRRRGHGKLVEVGGGWPCRSLQRRQVRRQARRNRPDHRPQARMFSPPPIAKERNRAKLRIPRRIGGGLQAHISSSQVLVDGPSDKPEAAVPRHAANLSYMSLTGIVIEVPRGAGTSALKKQWEKADVETKWNNSSFAKSRERSIRRKQLNDFERFKVMRLRKQVCGSSDGGGLGRHV